MASSTIGWEALKQFVTAIFESDGVPAHDAALLADTLVQADLWGHQSHGVLRAPWYMARLKSGAMRRETKISNVTSLGAIAVMDGHDGIGQVIVDHAAHEAVARAKQFGIGAVSVRNSNHFGTAMYFTRKIAEAGCIAFLSTNASPAMAPWGGRKKLVGNNPWSIAAPGGRHGPIILDIANTSVARGKIYLAKQKGLSIPAGWALTADGEPTTDPVAAIAGIIQPMGEHKGYAISVMMDVLSGVLSGSAFGSAVVGPYVSDRKSGCGHLVIALNVEAFASPAQFEERISTLVGELKSAPLAKGSDGVYLPFEVELIADAKNRREGITLPADTVRDLRQLAEQQNVAAPF